MSHDSNDGYEPASVPVAESRTSMRTRRAQQARERQRRATLIAVGAFVVLISLTLIGLLVLSASPPPSTTAMMSNSSLETSQAYETAEATETPAVSVEPTQPVVAAPASVAEPTKSTIGNSVQGRPIEAVVFGSGTRKYLLVGGVHGDEWGSSAVEEFIERMGSDPSKIPAGVELHVIPCLNPDGRALDSRGNANNVDLNRNMPSANWSSTLDPNDSSATRGLSGGASAGSEPESQALMKYMGNGFSNVVSVHSQGGIVDYDGDGGEAVARKIADRTGYPVKHLGYQAYIRGSMGLYVPEKWSIPIITVEMKAPGLSDGLFEGILAAFE